MNSLPAADLDHVLARTRELWEPVRGRNVFVTGGTGFFGRWLLESFLHVNEKLELGATLTALSRNPERFLETAPHLRGARALAMVRGDVRGLTPEGVLKQLPREHTGEFGFVIHAATESVAGPESEDELGMFETIVSGTGAALDFAAASGAKRFLLTSSGAVYGRQPAGMTHVPESYLGAPDCGLVSSAYGEGKRGAELLCALHQQRNGVEAVVARCFAFVGPWLALDAHFAIGNFIRDALRGGPIRVGGDGTPHRSYLYAADLAVWLWTLLLRGKAGERYNVGSHEDVTILELARTVAGCFDGRIDVQVAREPTPGMPASRYVPDVTRAERELGLSSQIPLSEAISRTAAWHLSRNPSLSPS